MHYLETLKRRDLVEVQIELLIHAHHIERESVGVSMVNTHTNARIGDTHSRTSIKLVKFSKCWSDVKRLCESERISSALSNCAQCS